jgi:hypothetical protein
MRYILALFGALLIFACTFILTSIIIALVIPKALFHIQIGPLYTDNPIGAMLALLAAGSSFRATLKRRAKK